MRRLADILRAATIEDVAGGLALFLLLVIAMWLAHGLGLPTGADELMVEVQ